MRKKTINVRRKTARFLILSSLALMATMAGAPTANAEYFGQLSGRTAELSAQAGLSVGVGLSQGDFGVNDYRNLSARINYAFNPNLHLFADFGMTALGSADDPAIGFGALYSADAILGKYVPGLHTAFKGSYHTVTLDGGGGGFSPFFNPVAGESGGEVVTSGSGSIGEFIPLTFSGGGSTDIDALSLEILFSGKRTIGDGINWYGNVGLHNLAAGARSTTEFGLGGGLTRKFNFGDGFVGVDFIDELTYGIGFRYYVN